MSWLNIAVVLGFLLVGYAWGRRQGRQEGFGLGLRYEPLELRRQALVEGRCPVCGRSDLGERGAN